MGGLLQGFDVSSMSVMLANAQVGQPSARINADNHHLFEDIGRVTNLATVRRLLSPSRICSTRRHNSLYIRWFACWSLSCRMEWGLDWPKRFAGCRLYCIYPGLIAYERGPKHSYAYYRSSYKWIRCGIAN